MKTKVSHTLDERIVEAIHKFATEDERPITDSAAIELLLKEALAARGIHFSAISADMDAVSAGKPTSRRKRA